jgi:hypothetical protein
MSPYGLDADAQRLRDRSQAATFAKQIQDLVFPD